MAVAPFVRGVEGFASIVAPCRAAPTSLVCAAGNARMPGQRVDVSLRTRAVVGPGFTAVARAHQPAQLDPHEQQVGVVRARRDPAHVRRPRSRRKAPART